MSTSRADIIKDKPIGTGLDAFRSSYAAICRDRRVPWSLDVVDQLTEKEIQSLTLDLLLALQLLPASRELPSARHAANLFADLSRLTSAVVSNDFNHGQTKSLFHAALSGDRPDDALIWKQAYSAVTEHTPSPRDIASSLILQTPRKRNTDSLVNSYETRAKVDAILKAELKCLQADIPNFFDVFFGCMPRLNELTDAVFSRCTDADGENPLFGPEGWSAWPPRAAERDVLAWLVALVPTIESFIPGIYQRRRKLFTQPRTALHGSTRSRSLDIGFIKSHHYGRPHWHQILVPGELKSNPHEDQAASSWFQLATYAREIFAAQDTRRFVLGFTLCGSLLRLWSFDRLGAIGSTCFDINTYDGGRHFVTMLLGFLCIDHDRLGYDASVIVSPGGQRHIEIKRDGCLERIIIDAVIRHASCIVGRATSCWKAHREGDLTPLVIKNSWQFTDRDHEGQLLLEATEKGVCNISRHYHHETVHAYGAVDQVRDNVRGGLDLSQARTHPLNFPEESPYRLEWDPLQNVRTSSKRPSSETTASTASPRKRLCSASPTKSTVTPSDRVHRRVIVRDYGKHIYNASSLAAMLAALSGCIQGHQSLHRAGILHRDISINNIMMNEDAEDPSQRAFLIDLDLAIREDRQSASGAEGITGTRAFMAVGALRGDRHTFLHDLESFFWVLVWLCCHYNGPDKPPRVLRFYDQWNYLDADVLAALKQGFLVNEADFLNRIDQHFTPYYAPLRPWVNRLRRVLFPGGMDYRGEGNEDMYASVLHVLRDAQEDLNILLFKE